MADEKIVESINEFWRNSPKIEDQLPVELSNGSWVEHVTCRCYECQKPVRSDHHRGTIRPSLKGYRMTSFGFCLACRLLTPFIYNVVPKGEIFALEKTDFKWGDGDVIRVDFKK